MGNFLESSVLSTDFALSCLRLRLDPPNLEAVAASETTSEALSKLPLLILLVA